MINFVTTASHAETLTSVAQSLGRRRCQIWHYESLFRRRTLPTGTWIFTDHERLSAFELSLAANIASQLRGNKATVLNHPAEVSNRYDLLRRFQLEGINKFAAWRCESMPRPDSFPVFIRNEFDHKRPKSGLIADQAALDERLAAMRRAGISLVGQLVIEFAGLETAPGLWERYSTYRVGNTVIAHHKGIDRNWIVKDGVSAAQLDKKVWDDFVRAEREFVVNNLYEEQLRRAFELAGIEYGRADFAVVNGAPQIYEINTNPTHVPWKKLFREIHPDRREFQLLSETRLQQAIRETDSPADQRVRLKHDMLKRLRGPMNRWRRSSWRP